MAAQRFAALRREYMARQTVNGTVDSHDLPLIELAVSLHGRLRAISVEMDGYVAEHQTHQARTVRGTTAHPLLSYEREITSELRQLNVELNRRANTRRGETQPSTVAEELPTLARLRVAK